MNVVYARGEASASEVWEALPDRPSRTAVRTLLRILEEKGRLGHRKPGREFIYRPTWPRTRAGRRGLRRGRRRAAQQVEPSSAAGWQEP